MNQSDNDVEMTETEIDDTIALEEEVVMTEEITEERFDRSALTFRAADGEMVDEDDRRVSMSISSEEPVERSFGLEVLEHTDESLSLIHI